jgi:carbonic anhydrase
VGWAKSNPYDQEKMTGVSRETDARSYNGRCWLDGRVIMKNPSRISRREFATLAAAGLSLATSKTLLALAQRDAGKPRSPINAGQALQDLLDGNRRFVKGQPTSPRRGPEDFRGLAEAQYPEAVIVSCADSRVAPEILFDVGVGDIFVVRVAGNVVSGAGVTVKGSIEYAVVELNVPLIVVLGHSGCGAVKAAIKHIDNKDSLPGAIDGLVELIKPAVAQSKGGRGDPLENAIRKNVEIGVERLKELQPILAPRVKDGKLKVLGAVYDLHTGSVTLVETAKS